MAITEAHARFNGFEAARRRQAKVCRYSNYRLRAAWFNGYECFEEQDAKCLKSPTLQMFSGMARDKALAEAREFLK